MPTETLTQLSALKGAWERRQNSKPNNVDITTLRIGRRGKDKRLAYDCFRTMVFGNRVYCPVAMVRNGGFKAGAKDGSLLDVMVLQGIAPSECQRCGRYDDGGGIDE